MFEPTRTRVKDEQTRVLLNINAFAGTSNRPIRLSTSSRATTPSSSATPPPSPRPRGSPPGRSPSTCESSAKHQPRDRHSTRVPVLCRRSRPRSYPACPHPPQPDRTAAPPPPPPPTSRRPRGLARMVWRRGGLAQDLRRPVGMGRVITARTGALRARPGCMDRCRLRRRPGGRGQRWQGCRDSRGHRRSQACVRWGG